MSDKVKCQSWGTMIIISGFMIQVMTFGTASSIGVYNIELLEYFQSSVAATSMIGAINIGLLLGAGPLASFLMRKISYRKVALLGSLLCSIGLLCCPFAPNIIYLDVFYGVVTGVGFCLLYVPSHTLSGLYFDKQLSLVTGIVTSGSGLGGCIFPLLCHYLIKEYGWRGSMLILAGINMNNFVFAGLMRPAPSQLKQTKVSEIQVDGNADDLQPENNIQGESSHSIEVEEKSMLQHTDTSKEDASKEGDNIAEVVQRKPLNHSGDNDEQHNLLNKPNELGELVKQVNQPKNCYVLCNFVFLMYFISNVFWNMGMSVVIVLGPEFFTEIGTSKEDAAVAITICNAFVTIGGTVGGAIGNLKCINRMFLYIFCNISFGVFTIIFTFKLFHVFVLLAIDLVFLGLTFGMLLGLLVAVTADILGVGSLGDGMGYLMLANGIGNLLGPPIGGWFRDFSGSYIASFVMSGSVTIFGGVIMCAVPIRDRFFSPAK